MEPDHDPQLHQLLREWQVPDAPSSLDRRVLGCRRSWWRFLLTGHIRVPVPLGLAVVAALIAMAVFLARDRGRPVLVAPASARFNLRNFQPVEDVQVRVIRSPYASQ
jgi:hypothetical protein